MLRRTQSIASRVERDIFGPETIGSEAVEREPVEREPVVRETAGRETAGHDNVGAMRAEIERAFSPIEGSPLRRAQPDAKARSAEQDATRPEAGPTFVPKVERRKAERRGMEALRDEALRNLISRVEDKNFGGLRDRVPWKRRIKPSRIVLLLVALAAGGLAAFLATQRDQASIQPVTQPLTEPVTEIVKEARTQILVAKEAIGIGQRLSASSVEWQDWPLGAVRPEYVTIAAAPEAITEMAGSLARLQFFPGEPIREQKLAPAGPGILSAVLEEGMRGVSVSVAAESASGGFIVPSDHVDVVVTRSTDTDQFSETILHNVRVLAINARLGEAPTTEESEGPEVFTDQAIATLELDAAQSEVLISAATAGRLSLVLRSILDFAETDRIEQRPANSAIRMSSPFWSN